MTDRPHIDRPENRPTPLGVGFSVGFDGPARPESGGVLIVIPARWGSSRFPGKALADLGGKPLIVRVAENAGRVKRADRVVVATDDARIEAAVTEAGLDCEMTGTHNTGTDRIAEVAARCDAAVVVNLQGDEPLLRPDDVDALIGLMLADPELEMATCGHKFADAESWRDPNVVKIVVGTGGRALYFSRSPIPGTFPGSAHAGHTDGLRHVGIYAFRREALFRFAALPATPLERAEGLEQLRALENGMRIGVLTIAGGTVGVDTPADLERVRAAWREPGGY